MRTASRNTFHWVEIAIGIEGIAGVVGGDRRRNAGGRQFLETASPRARAGVPLRGPADTCCTSAATRLARPASATLSMIRAAVSVSWRASEQQWPTTTCPSKQVAQRRFGDGLQRGAPRDPAVSVDMKVDVEPVVECRLEQQIKLGLEVGPHLRQAAEQTPPHSTIMPTRSSK